MADGTDRQGMVPFLCSPWRLLAQALNAIAVASYKKLVLVSLISRGALPALPKFASSIVHRHIKARSSASLLVFPAVPFPAPVALANAGGIRA